MAPIENFYRSFIPATRRGLIRESRCFRGVRAWMRGLAALRPRFSRIGGIEIFYPAGAKTPGEEGKRTVPRR